MQFVLHKITLSVMILQWRRDRVVWLPSPLSSERSAGTSIWDRLNATIALLNIIDLLTVTIINICPTIWLFLSDLLCKLRWDSCWQMSTKSTAYRRTYSQNILCKKKKKTERPTLTNHNWQTPLILPYIGIAHLLTRNSFARTMLYTATVLRNFSA